MKSQSTDKTDPPGTSANADQALSSAPLEDLLKARAEHINVLKALLVGVYFNDINDIDKNPRFEN